MAYHWDTGGMGPAATADMLEKFVVELRHASCDQQHIPVYLSALYPDIPRSYSSSMSVIRRAFAIPLSGYLHMLEDAGAGVSLSHATLRIIGLMIYRTSRKRE